MSQTQLLIALLIPAVLLVGGSLGYYFIEGWQDPLDCIYMTVITLATIGYAEVHKLSPRGRIFTIFLILGGVATFLYTVTAVISALISGELRDLFGRRAMERSLDRMKNHMIVCGFGRMGQLVCREFSEQKLPFVIVDKDTDLIKDLNLPHGVPIAGDATNDDVLKRAGIERARALVTVMRSDAENLFTTMSARLLNPNLYIVARVEDADSQTKLLRAGANRVVSPYHIGGSRVAMAVLRPTVVDFIELATRTEHIDLQLEETRIAEGSRLIGKSLRTSEIGAELRVTIVAVKKPSGKMVVSPTPDEKMDSGDILVAIGHRDQLDKLEQIAGGP